MIRHPCYHYYSNKLKRNFLTDAPNKVWGSDITYAKVGMDFLYLCVVIDLYSRKKIFVGTIIKPKKNSVQR